MPQKLLNQYENNALNELYIHLHWKHIGLLNNGIGVKDEMIEIYKRKQQIKTSVKKEYLVQIERQNKNFADFLLKIQDEKERDDIINAFEEGLIECLEEILKENQSKTTKLYEAGKQFYNLLNEVVNKTSADKMNEIVTLIIKGLEQVPGLPDSAAIVKAYTEQNERFQPTTRLKRALATYKNNFISDDNLKTVINTLNKFLNRIQGKKIDFNIDSIKSQIGRNIFSKSFGEVVGFGSLACAQTTIENTLEKPITFSHQGMTRVKSLGYKQKMDGKTDIALEGLTISITTKGGEQQTFCDIKAGISEKFYLDAPWAPGQGPVAKTEFSSGSGGRIGPTIDNIVGKSNYIEKYYIYNVLAHSGKNKKREVSLEKNLPTKNLSEIEEANSQISRLIIARQIIRIFASANVGTNSPNNVDFSQVFYANGYLVPMYKIVLWVLDQLDKKVELRKSTGDINTLGISFSIPDQAKWQPAVREDTAEKRSSSLRHKISDAIIESTIHMQNLISAMPNSIKTIPLDMN